MRYKIIYNKNKNRPKERGTARMKRLSGFSLMEMMVVLLIVAVVAAASAPMVNKKMLNAAAEKSPWVWTGLGNSIAYNINELETQTATIGAITEPDAANNARLFIQTKDNIPAIAFRNGEDSVWKILTGSSSIKLSTSDGAVPNSAIMIGESTVADNNSVVIGTGAEAGAGSISLGTSAEASDDSVAIGNSTITQALRAVAIGSGSRGIGERSVAIGSNAIAPAAYTIAIGDDIRNNAHDTIAVGRSIQNIGENSVIIGNECSPLEGSGAGNSRFSTAIGYQAEVGYTATAVGYQARSNHLGVAIGGDSFADQTAIAMGVGAEANMTGGIAIGTGAKVSTRPSPAASVASSDLANLTDVTDNNNYQKFEVKDITVGMSNSDEPILIARTISLDAVDNGSSNEGYCYLHEQPKATCSECKRNTGTTGNQDTTTTNQHEIVKPCEGCQSYYTKNEWENGLCDNDMDGLCNGCDTDDDNDGFSDQEELANNTDPFVPDTYKYCKLCNWKEWRPDRITSGSEVLTTTKGELRICKTCKKKADKDYVKSCWGGNDDYFAPYNSKHSNLDSDGDGKCNICDPYPNDAYDGLRQEPSAYADDFIDSAGEIMSGIAIGTYSQSYDLGTALGYNTKALDVRAVALGNNANTQTGADKAIAIGNLASVGENASGGIAIGNGAMIGEDAQKGIAIGHEATANGVESVAIGPGAKATLTNQIVLGNANTAVYIPGKLIVDKHVYLAATSGHNVYLNTQREDSGTDDLFARIKRDAALAGVTGDERNLEVDVKQGWTPGDEHRGGTLYYTSSDRRLKDVGEVFTAGLEEIKKLEVFNYTFKKDPDKTPRVGVMAQDLQKIFPKAVFEGKDGFLRIRMEDMFYALVNAVKQLDAKIEEIKNNQIAQLLDKVAKLEEQNVKQSEINKKQEEMIEKLIKQNEEIISQNKEIVKQNKDLKKQLKKAE